MSTSRALTPILALTALIWAVSPAVVQARGPARYAATSSRSIAGRSVLTPPGTSIPGGVTTAQRIVALTFDDGPSPYTPQILNELRALHVPATFFVVGKEVRAFPALVRTEVADGNEVANHTYDHADLVSLSSAGITAEVEDTQDAVWQAAHVRPRWLRPPYGFVDARVAAVAASLGLRTVLWDVDPLDWARPGVDVIVARALYQVRPGSIIIMHDGGGDRSETVAAVPAIVESLRARGYKFVILDALFGLKAAHRCDERGAARWFSSAGVAAAPSHALYHAWLARYCDGVNLGPATSPEYRLERGVVAQSFADTGHRLEWHTAGGSVEIVREWAWAARAFARRGVAPRPNTPITDAWFDLYFEGHNRGPAVSPPHTHGDDTTQCFLRACASAAGRTVHWIARR